MAISKKTWTGIARETTPGTAVVTPTMYIPTKTVLKGGKKREYLNEERGNRDMNYGVVDSIRQTAMEMKGPWYNDVGGYMILAAMGSVTDAQPNVGTAPTVWKHTFALADVPPAMTLHRSMDAVTYYAPYSVLEKLTWSFQSEGKLLEVAAHWLGLYAVVNGTPPTPTYSSLLPFAGYAPTITNSLGVSSDIIDMTIEFVQKITLWYPANGSQDYVTAYFGEREVMVDFTARFDNPNVYNLWRNNTNDSLLVDFLGNTIASTYKQELNISIPVVTYDTIEHDTGKDNVMIKAKGKGLSNPAGLINVFVQNTVPNYNV